MEETEVSFSHTYICIQKLQVCVKICTLSDHFNFNAIYMHRLVSKFGGAVTDAENIESLPPYLYIEKFWGGLHLVL